jgi:hypothetical protein
VGEIAYKMTGGVLSMLIGMLAVAEFVAASVTVPLAD